MTAVAPHGPTVAEPLPAEAIARIAEAFRASPSQMTSVLARQLGVTERDVVRHMPDGRSVELDPAQWEPLLRSLEELGQVHVICSNGAVTLECFGQFGNFSQWKNYFNVQTKSLDMHIRSDRLAAIFAVRKPSHMDGVETLSIQLFDPEGVSAFKVFLTFGSEAPKPERVAQFEQRVAQFKLA